MDACADRCSYTNWTSTARQCDDFFSDRNAIDLYKNHVKKVLTRVNTVTGLTYGSDPTIFGAQSLSNPQTSDPRPVFTSNFAGDSKDWLLGRLCGPMHGFRCRLVEDFHDRGLEDCFA